MNKFDSINITARYKTDFNITLSNQGSISVTHNDSFARRKPAKIKWS